MKYKIYEIPRNYDILSNFADTLLNLRLKVFNSDKSDMFSGGKNVKVPYVLKPQYRFSRLETLISNSHLTKMLTVPL